MGTKPTPERAGSYLRVEIWGNASRHYPLGFLTRAFLGCCVMTSRANCSRGERDVRREAPKEQTKVSDLVHVGEEHGCRVARVKNRPKILAPIKSEPKFWAFLPL
jgi:hypothetical protein